jgi:hypothetical protein
MSVFRYLARFGLDNPLSTGGELLEDDPLRPSLKRLRNTELSSGDDTDVCVSSLFGRLRGIPLCANSTDVEVSGAAFSRTAFAALICEVDSLGT